MGKSAREAPNLYLLQQCLRQKQSLHISILQSLSHDGVGNLLFVTPELKFLSRCLAVTVP